MKKKLQILKFENKDDGEREFWLSKSPEERFEALEILRQRFYGYDETTQRFQRVIEYI